MEMKVGDSSDETYYNLWRDDKQLPKEEKEKKKQRKGLEMKLASWETKSLMGWGIFSNLNVFIFFLS